VTTNEADRTGERTPDDDVFPPDEPTTGEATTDETDVDDFTPDESSGDESRADETMEDETDVDDFTPDESSGDESGADETDVDDEFEPSAEGGTVVEGEPPPAEPSALDDRRAAESQPEAALGGTDAAATDLAPGADESLLADATGYQDRWYEIQTGFVDEPSRAVQSAGELLTEVMDDLTRRLTTELEALDGRQGAGDEVSTEDLRMAFQRFRSFFDRLLTA
jgi:hypothetical protein